MNLAPQIVQRWSVNSTKPITFPTISPKLYAESYKLFKEKMPLWGKPKNQLAGVSIHLFSSEKSDYKNPCELKQAADKTFNVNWANWGAYIANKFTVYASFRGDYGGHWRCTCPEGRKKYVCKHAVLSMVNEGILTFPQGVKDLAPVQGLKKKGRPKNLM